MNLSEASLPMKPLPVVAPPPAYDASPEPPPYAASIHEPASHNASPYEPSSENPQLINSNVHNERRQRNYLFSPCCGCCCFLVLTAIGLGVGVHIVTLKATEYQY